ncbi:hypothetical protein ACQ4PT_021981 [Festuca glaucescens]
MGVEAQATAAAAYTSSSNDRQVRVSVRLRPQPAESYIHMQTEDTLLQHPSVLAACGDLLLVQMFVCDDAATDTDLSYNQNMFVYKTNPACLWLRCLPNPDTFPGFAQAFGLVPTDEGFVVASFLTFKTPGFNRETGEVSKLLRCSSATERWDLSSPTMPYDGDALRPHLWETDKVFSPPDGTIYWVDYYRGLLASQVTTGDNPPQLCFIRLPGIKVWTTPIDFCKGSRTVGVCKDIVKFVDIDNGLFGRKKSGFTVKVWTLRMLELKWDQVSTLRGDDLWALSNLQSASLPRCVPQFPMVSTHDVHALNFILLEGDYAEEWIRCGNCTIVALILEWLLDR